VRLVNISIRVLLHQYSLFDFNGGGEIIAGRGSNPTVIQDALDLYRDAREYVTSEGFGDEISWQESMCFEAFSESDFLREAAWVILCTGYKESILRRKFGYLSLCFCDWESGSAIVRHEPQCRSTALAGFNNPRKIDAILQIARYISTGSFSAVKSAILANPISRLQDFPYIGPVTAWHLAKNLGYDDAKPDRHLCRMSEELGYADPHHLCAAISLVTGDSRKVVDIVLWRYAAETRWTPQIKREIAAQCLSGCKPYR
jgi:hypothetical protein